jgi:hypothetical protein
MAGRVVIAFLTAIALGGWVVFQILFRKKTGAEVNNEVMFIAFFAAVWIMLCLLFW